MRSFYDRVPGRFNGLQWVKENQEKVEEHKTQLES